jgi:hypothetical protein
VVPSLNAVVVAVPIELQIAEPGRFGFLNTVKSFAPFGFCHVKFALGAPLRQVTVIAKFTGTGVPVVCAAVYVGVRLGTIERAKIARSSEIHTRSVETILRYSIGPVLMMEKRLIVTHLIKKVPRHVSPCIE